MKVREGEEAERDGGCSARMDGKIDTGILESGTKGKGRPSGRLAAKSMISIFF